MDIRINFKTYAIISIDDLNKIDFEQTGVTSRDTIRRSIDLTKFLIAWDSEPEFIENGDVIPIGQYDHSEIIQIMATDEWTDESN
jgi:hypothetical protein